MIRAGIVGLGKMGISHYSILNAHPEVNVVAVCDTSSFVLRAVGQYGKAETFSDFGKMVRESSLDCAVIATPPSTHFDLAKTAMESELEVFVEKPFCLKYSDSQKLSEIATEQKRVNQVGYHYRFIAAFRKARELIESGLVGDISHFRVEAYGPVVLKPTTDTWRTRRQEGGGCLYDYASHAIDMANYLFGKPRKVAGTILKSIYSQSVTDAVFSSLYYSNGLTGQLSVNWSEPTYRKMSMRVEVYGTKGKIVSDRQECIVYLNSEQEKSTFDKGWNKLYTTDLTKPVYFYLRGEEYSEQLACFVESVKKRDFSNINNFKNAMQADQVIEWLLSDAE